ncbi:MAG TPA: response regulator transcription factor [Thermoleophilaceae bacterium]|nr:response regulator transcription factor [Thermoleophilaceae bacterium]
MDDGGAIRVVLGDDSYLTREALTHLLAAEEGIDVVATCEDEGSLLRAVEDLDPEVVVTDIRMPPSNTDEGLRIATLLRQTHPDIGVVVLSQFTEPRYGLALLEHGSDRRAYLLKERVHHGGQLVAAIEAVSQGGSVIDAKVVEALVDERRRAERSPLAELTPRELEILSFVARGHDNQAIADELVLTKRAVEKHIHSIFLKLGLTYATEVSPRVKATLVYLAEHEALDDARRVEHDRRR